MKIEQCLFGYDDGHRLLASSVRLDDSSASLLTLLTDAAPGVIFGSSDGYWTGVPIPKLKKYALVRTWPAPEMPRPGCVWSHVLLLDTVIFEHLIDLSSLKAVAKRPEKSFQVSEYSSQIEWDVESYRLRKALSAKSSGVIHRAVFDLYENDRAVLTGGQADDLEDVVFAIWTQQWPKLRRNFKFQTAFSTDIANRDTLFDLQIAVDTDRIDVSAENKGAWVTLAAEDILLPKDDGLRAFLRRYGTDVKRQRGSFRPLCELYILDKNPHLLGEVDLPDMVLTSFPNSEDAVRLKQDIADGRIAEAHQIEVLKFELSSGNQNFPAPTIEGIQRLERSLHSQSRQFLDLAEMALSADSELGRAVADTMLNAIPAEEFWSLTINHSSIRQKLIHGNPHLLDAPQVANLDKRSLQPLLSVIPKDHDVGTALVERFKNTKDRDLIETIVQKFPVLSVRRIIDLCKDQSAYNYRLWFEAFRSHTDKILTDGVFREIERRSTLYVIAEICGWVSFTMVQAGTEIWSRAFQRAKNDINEDEGYVLSAFALCLAIVVGGKGAPFLLEKFFDFIHSKISKSYLPWKAGEILSQGLPVLGWSRNWDTSLRLRLAVAECFVRNSFDPNLFAKLSHDKKTRDLLREAAGEVNGGKLYQKAIK